jgi:ABC-type phosphate transport system substrate-binding protein
MRRHDIWPLVLALAVMTAEASAAGDIVVIGNANLTKLDAETVERIYTGKAVKVGDIPVTAVNVTSDNPVRRRFLKTYLNRDDDVYVAYWTVRRYSGLGAPPKELPSSAEVINYVKSTPGAIGYVEEGEVLPPGLNILLKQ